MSGIYWSVFLVLWLELRSSWAYSYELRPQVKFSGYDLSPEIVVGTFADYGQAEVGKKPDADLVLADSIYGCADANSTLPGSLPYDGDNIVVMELSEECDDYEQAKRAEEEGAKGVVFYYTADSSKKWWSSRNGQERLSIRVAVIELWGNVLDRVTGKKSPSYTTVSIEGKHFAVPPQQRTFYFIVTAFCVLILLSCLWFVASYFRRCRYTLRNRRRQARAQNVARKAINKLKIRSYKASKGGSQESEICAVCLEHYNNNDIIRILPCRHEFHRNCVDPWLKIKHTCPLCKRSITNKTRNSSSSSTSTAATSSSAAPTTLTDETRHTTITAAFSPSFHSLSSSTSSSDSSSLSAAIILPLHQMRLLHHHSSEVAINMEETSESTITENQATPSSSDAQSV